MSSNESTNSAMMRKMRHGIFLDEMIVRRVVHLEDKRRRGIYKLRLAMPHYCCQPFMAGN